MIVLLEPKKDNEERREPCGHDHNVFKDGTKVAKK
jgi:hypothetical protein